MRNTGFGSSYKKVCAGILADGGEDQSDLEKVRFPTVWARRLMLGIIIYMTKIQPYLKAWEK